MAAISFEQWRWQWLEIQSGGLLSQFAPLLQLEHQVHTGLDPSVVLAKKGSGTRKVKAVS